MDDRGRIENVLGLYTHLLDEARFAELGQLFAEGSVHITGGPHGGRSGSGATEVEQLYRDIVALDPETGDTGTRHMIASIRVLVDGDAADSHCYFAVLQQTPTLPLQVVASGYYDDRLVRDGDDDWRFEARHIVCDQTGDLSQHMK